MVDQQAQPIVASLGTTDLGTLHEQDPLRRVGDRAAMISPR
jgi:hypothetical protein